MRYDRIFVIGNGPSLKHQDLNLLKGEFTICSNAFFHAYSDLSWRPTILTIEDPLPAIDNAEFFNNDTDSIKIIPHDLRDIIRSDHYIKFRRMWWEGGPPEWPLFSDNVWNVAYWGGTVSYLALQIAATFKPKEVILIGTDLTYEVPESAHVSGAIVTSTEDDPNHFHPDYFGAGKRWHLPDVDRMQRALTKAYHELSSRGIVLMNATEGGNLKVVPRVSFEEVF